MMNLSKYRKLSVLAAIVLVIAWMSAMATFWNAWLKTDITNEGWTVFFMILVFFCAIALFYFAFSSADSLKREKELKEAYESGKMEILQENERKKQSENREQLKEEDIRQKAEAILAGINSSRSVSGLCNKLLANLAREMGFVQGVMYTRNSKESVFNPSGEYALTDRKPEPFKDSETLAGQSIQEKSVTVIHDVPQNYFSISSGLGSSAPGCLVFAPVAFNNETIAVLELAAFRKPDSSEVKIMENVLAEISAKLNKFIADKS